jgi:hypothetical protein
MDDYNEYCYDAYTEERNTMILWAHDRFQHYRRLCYKAAIYNCPNLMRLAEKRANDMLELYHWYAEN